MKKILFICTAILMVSSLFSCNQEKSNTSSSSSLSSSDISLTEPADTAQTNDINNNSDKPATAKYYNNHVLEGSDEFSDITSINCFEDKIYVLGQKAYVPKRSLFRTDLNTLETVPDKNDDITTYTSGCAKVYTDKKGNTYECTYNDIKIHDKDHNLVKTIDNEFFAEYDFYLNIKFYNNVAVNENGEIYIAVSSSTTSPESIRIIKLNSSFKIKYITKEGAFSDCSSCIVKLFIGKDQNPVLCTKSDITYVNEISAENGKILLKYDIPYSDEIIGEYGNFNIIYRLDNTIYGYDHTSDKTSEILSNNSDASLEITSNIKDNFLITEQIEIGKDSGKLNIYNKQGMLEKSIGIPEEERIRDINIIADGTVYFSQKYYESTKKGPMVSESSQYHIFRLNDDGTTEKIYSGEKIFGQHSTGWITYNFVADSQGNICVCPWDPQEDTVHATYISSSGEQSDITFECPERMSKILCVRDDMYIMCCDRSNNSTRMLHINKKTHTIDKTSDIELNWEKIIFGSGKDDINYLSDGVVYGYNISDNSSKKIFSGLDLDDKSFPYDLKGFTVTDNDNMFYICRDNNNISSKSDNDTNKTVSNFIVHLQKPSVSPS